MPKDQLFYTNGKELKNITLPQYPNEAWNWISNPPDDDETDLYACVAAVFRAANLTADVLSTMPFVVLNEAGDEVDSSRDYQNKVGFLKNPREILRLWRLSLFMENRAYGFMEGNRVKKDLRYIAPQTITRILIDQTEGVTGFERTINGKVTKWDTDRVFWMFRRDHTTEILPSPNTEFRALMSAAGVLYYSDDHLQSFFERGGIKPTLLKVAGVPSREEREKIEKWWDKIARGATKLLGKVAVADTMETEVIGEGAEAFKDSVMHREKLEDIALAAGMPLSLLLSNSANYATARVEYSTWFNNSVVPWSEFIQDNMNEKLFKPMGLTFKFMPDITDEGTQEEQERAGAYAALVASNILPSVASQMLGYELPPDYEEYTQLDEDYFEMLTRKAEITQTGVPGAMGIEDVSIEEPKPPKPTVVPDIDRASTPKGGVLPAGYYGDVNDPKETFYPSVDGKISPLTLDQLSELGMWRQLAFRKLKRGDDMNFPFVAKQLDEGTASMIRARLPKCTSEDEIKAVFELGPITGGAETKNSDIIMLAESLNRAVDTMIKPELENEPIIQEG